MGLMNFNIDLSNDTEQSIELGEQIPPGWYLCTFADVFEQDEKNQLVLKFTVAAGPFVAKQCQYWLPDPDYVEGDKQKTALRRAKMIAKRIGVIQDEDLGKDYSGSGAPRKWEDFLEEAYFVHITEQADRKDPMRKPFVGIDYAGIYPLDYWGTQDAPAIAANGKPEKLPVDWPASLNQYRKASKKAGGGNGGGAAGAPVAPTGPAAPPASPVMPAAKIPLEDAYADL